MSRHQAISATGRITATGGAGSAAAAKPSRLLAFLTPTLGCADEVVRPSLADAEFLAEAGEGEFTGLLDAEHESRSHLPGVDSGLAECLREPAGVPVGGFVAGALTADCVVEFADGVVDGLAQPGPGFRVWVGVRHHGQA
jgi:hypothetical protein